jgi:hypothetical protein
MEHACLMLHIPRMSSLLMCHLIFFIENVSSSPSVEPSPLSDSSLEQLIRCSHCLCWPPDNYSSSILTVNSLSEPTSYRDGILHPE